MDAVRERVTWRVVASLLFVAQLPMSALAQEAFGASARRSIGEGVAVKAATQLVESREVLATIWPGFWDSGQVVGIFPVRNGTLVLHARGERIGEDPKSSGMVLPKSLIGRASLVPNRVGTGVFDLDFKVGERSLVAVSLIPPFAPYRGTAPGDGWLSDSAASLVMFGVHESFHAFQRANWLPLAGSSLVFAVLEPVAPYQAWLDSLWVASSLADERVALRRAVDAASCAQASEHIGAYDALREVRLVRMPEPFRAYEDAQERAEGIANWVGYEGVHRASTQDTAGVRRTVSNDLTFSYRDGNGQALRGWRAYSGWHLYATGAAKALIVARCDVDDWRARIAAGATLQERLRLVQAVGRRQNRLQS